AGLRPGVPDGVPFIGPHPALEGLYVNTGHFRNGVVMAPGSAQLLTDLLLDRVSFTDAGPYRP
ncbi:MAG: FAD-dependent oxidoreductase, partial [Thiohalobacterales bacterium]|nr:FAD-dependent oxidoreductase [Thiohalobacterales bacterium]